MGLLWLLLLPEAGTRGRVMIVKLLRRNKPGNKTSYKTVLGLPRDVAVDWHATTFEHLDITFLILVEAYIKSRCVSGGLGLHCTSTRGNVNR